MTPFEYVRGEEEKIKPTANPVIAYFSLIAIMKFVSIFSLCNIALKSKLDSFHAHFALVKRNHTTKVDTRLQLRPTPDEKRLQPLMKNGDKGGRGAIQKMDKFLSSSNLE